MHSIRLRFMLLVALLLALLLLLLNTVPAVLARDTVFQEKQRSLGARASELSGTLSTLERLSSAGVAEALGFFDLTEFDRVAVYDAGGAPLFDSGEGEAAAEDVSAALGGRVVFRSRYAHGAFHSSIATPVSDGGVLLGALLLQEEDEAHADSIRAVQKHLGILSLVIAAATLLSGSLFVQRMTRRLRSLIASMRTVAKGDYHFRHVSRGRDEISRLGTEFNALTERLESNEEERRRFVADASHELKTPLAAIRLLSDSILHNRGIAADTAREFVADIAEETKRLQKTTEKLLLLSRLDGREEAAPVALELAAAARDVLDSLHAFAREKNVTLRTELEPGCVVLAPRESVEHILYNLVDNAVKYNVPDGSVLVSLRAEGSEAVLTVADTGIGIPEKERAKIFDRFYRVDKARSREGGGSGLGLSIVHDAVLALGGDVRVEPNTPRGTRFIVRLPRLSQERTT